MFVAAEFNLLIHLLMVQVDLFKTQHLADLVA